VDEHVALEFSVIEESFFTSRMYTRIELITMNCHVLLQRGSIIENFTTGFKMTSKRFGH
jgi:hypothetical protein